MGDSTAIAIEDENYGKQESSKPIPIPTSSRNGPGQHSLSYDRTKKLKRLEWLTGRPRSLTRTGDNTLRATNIPSEKRKLMADMFTSLIELKWRWVIFTFALLYASSWTLFAIGWYTILHFHGDMDNFRNESWVPCVSGIKNFAHAFLFSLETQHTTGYGHYYISDECTEAIFLLMIQSIAGVILEGFLVGLIFTKMTRAKRRSATLMFSKHAVISPRDGQLCFMFRVADWRSSCPLLQVQIRAQLIRKRLTQEGEEINYYKEELEVQGDDEKNGQILLLWPTIIVHKINSSSPLRNLSPVDLDVRNSSFEIVVILEGVIEATGNAVQVRTSYLPSEILWGQRLASLETTKLECEQRVIDYLLFHNTCNATSTPHHTRTRRK